MLNRILPRPIDGTYRGHPAAVWLLVTVVILKTGIALGAIFNGRAAAQRGSAFAAVRNRRHSGRPTFRPAPSEPLRIIDPPAPDRV